MKFHDPQRPKLTNSTPCWLTAPHIALPHINIKPWPLENQRIVAAVEWPAFRTEYTPRFSLEVMINGSWKTIVQPLKKVEAILFSWYEDPEHTLVYWWHVEPPSEIQPQESIGETKTQIVTKLSIEDLGL